MSDRPGSRPARGLKHAISSGRARSTMATCAAINGQHHHFTRRFPTVRSIHRPTAAPAAANTAIGSTCPINRCGR